MPLRVSMETALGVMSALVLLLTLTVLDWMERIFGLEPDGGSGRTEWGWAMSLVVAAFVLFAVRCACGRGCCKRPLHIYK